MVLGQSFGNRSTPIKIRSCELELQTVNCICYLFYRERGGVSKRQRDLPYLQGNNLIPFLLFNIFFFKVPCLAHAMTVTFNNHSQIRCLVLVWLNLKVLSFSVPRIVSGGCMDIKQNPIAVSFDPCYSTNSGLTVFSYAHCLSCSFS